MLDIIIPAYKDMEGLYRTLNSVHYPQYKDWVTITVIDDCSHIDYSKVMLDYPDVHFHILKENRGPGHARQYGIDHTKEPYFIFIDCGDILLSKYSLLEIKDELELHPDYYIFFWTWITEKHNNLSSIHHRSTQGWVYKREFFNLFKVKFCDSKIGGYAHEDVGFNRTCVCILTYLERRDGKQYSQFSSVPIYRKIFNEDSITNTGKYKLNKMIPGLAENAALSIKELEENNIDLDILLTELNAMMFSLYRNFLRCIKEDPYTAFEHWHTIRNFYINIYKKYESLPQNATYRDIKMRANLNLMLKYTNKPNIKKFLQELNDNVNCPENYYLT